MTIHSFWARRKAVLYWVTKGLAQELRTAISAWMSVMSSSEDSRSTCAMSHSQYQLMRDKLERDRLKGEVGEVDWARVVDLTCLIATISPVAFSIAL